VSQPNATASFTLKLRERDAAWTTLIFKFASLFSRQEQIDLVVSNRNETLEILSEEGRRNEEISKGT
jgi:hypothetical protein